LWDFTSRIHCSDMKLIGAIKGLVQTLWHENTRPFSNRKYILKLIRGSMDCEPQYKHFTDMIQKKLYDRYRTVHSAFKLGQRSFHKCKPWYVRINIICNICCCRYHIEYGYYYHAHTHTQIYFMYCITPLFINLVCKSRGLYILSKIFLIWDMP
jgi:hypothetical protein